MDWSKLVSSEDSIEDLASQCRVVLRSSPSPWKTLASGLDPRLAQAVMDILQTELDLDDVSRYRMKCLRCLRVLGERYDVVPSSFFCQSAEIFGDHPVRGGGFADIWKGSMTQITIAFKVLRIFADGHNAIELFKNCRREALLWRQLRHPSILPFFGVSDKLFAPRLCLISPWMDNGSLVEFLQRHPEHDRMKAIPEIAEGIQYLHNLDPPIVHGDIKGANILVKEDLSCCLADFGLALIAESHSPGSSAMVLRGSLRWLPPEMMDYSLFDNKYVTALDIYSFGCTIIEMYTGEPPFSHIKRDTGVITEVLIKKEKPARPSTDLFPSDQLWFLVISCLSFAAKERPTTDSVISSLKDLDAASRIQPAHSLINWTFSSQIPQNYLIPGWHEYYSSSTTFSNHNVLASTNLGNPFRPSTFDAIGDVALETSSSHKCDECEQTFTSEHKLIKHRKSHAESTLFKCKYCPDSFMLDRALARHVRVRHNDRLRTLESRGRSTLTSTDLESPSLSSTATPYNLVALDSSQPPLSANLLSNSNESRWLSREDSHTRGPSLGLSILTDLPLPFIPLLNDMPPSPVSDRDENVRLAAGGPSRDLPPLHVLRRSNHLYQKRDSADDGALSKFERVSLHSRSR